MPKKLTTEEFISRAVQLHGTKYDYSKVKYVSSDTKVCMICGIHGEFYQRPATHLIGRGCIKCGGSFKLTTEQFIAQSKLVHGDYYDYSNTQYRRNRHNNEKVSIGCPIHGEFWQLASNHMRGSRCPLCFEKSVHTKETFIFLAERVHGNKYDYSDIQYINNKLHIEIRCPKHGIFKQRPDNHIYGNGCPICNASKGELKIRDFLIANLVCFEQQKVFSGCRDTNPLPFDMYLPDYNIAIEYDGIQHFKVIEGWGGISTLEIINAHDEIKTKYCNENNITLLRIPYTSYDDIEDVLSATLFKSP